MVYDCTQINNELDILEIRLNILDPYVDFFVISESVETFQGNPKPLYFAENKERFAKWKDKIIYNRVGAYATNDVFERTAYQKDCIRDALVNCKPDDIIYYGDVDEIWKPQDIELHKIYKLEQNNYCYYLNNRSSELWQGTNVCAYQKLKDLNEIRANHFHVIKDAGWHFTNLGGAEQVINKLESYDHSEYNTDEVKSKIAERIANNEDYVGRKYDWQGKPFMFWQDESDLPDYLKENKQKWINLFQ